MTTEDLIEILKRYPGMRVCVEGYEGGFDDPRAQVRELTNDDGDWHYGEYREKYESDDQDEVFTALCIFRRSGSNSDYNEREDPT